MKELICSYLLLSFSLIAFEKMFLLKTHRSKIFLTRDLACVRMLPPALFRKLKKSALIWEKNTLIGVIYG